MRTQLIAHAQTGIDVLKRLVGAGPWSWELLQASKDDRFVFKFEGPNNECIVGKFCTDDNSGENYFHALKTLSKQKFSSLEILPPIAYDARHRLLLLPVARGVPCHGMESLSNDNHRLQRIGLALRELHDSQVALGALKTMDHHLKELVKPTPTELAAAFPEYSSVIESTLEEIKVQEGRWGRLAPVPLHRDYQLRQLFDDGKHITVIDWDLCAQGDPAFDVGYFTAYLKTHYSPSEAALGISAFLAGYKPSQDLLGRIPTYEHFNFLRRACRRFRLKDEGWESALGEMLARVKSQGVVHYGKGRA